MTSQHQINCQPIQKFVIGNQQWSELAAQDHLNQDKLSMLFTIANTLTLIQDWRVSIYTNSIDTNKFGDIYAQKGSAKIAINLCFEGIEISEIERKQAQFKAEGVRGLWLLLPQEGAVCSLDERFDYKSQDIPIFHIIRYNQFCAIEGIVYFNDGCAGRDVGFFELPLPPNAFIYFLMTKKLQFKLEYDDEVYFHASIQDRNCFRCHSSINTVSKVVYTRRIFGQFIPEDYWQAACIRSVPSSEVELINHYFSQEYGFNRLKPMFSKFVQARYMANSCSHCGVIMGAFFEDSDFYSPITLTPKIRSTLDAKTCFWEQNDGTGAWVLDGEDREVDTMIDDLLELELVNFCSGAYFPEWYSLFGLPDGDDDEDGEIDPERLAEILSTCRS